MWVNFTGPYVASLVNGLSLDKPFYIVSHDMYREMSTIHRYLSRITADNKDYSFDKIALEICGLFLKVNSIEKGKERQVTSAKLGTAERIKDYIDSLVIPNVNLDDISRVFSLEKGYIIHRFNDKFGISPYKYINQRRIDAAKVMLAENSMKISEISNALGYNGTQHFSSSFKNATGMTPSEFASEYKYEHRH
jgi:AraC-like DNA-binding protein